MEELPKINDKLTLHRPHSTPNETHYLITNVIRDATNHMNSRITFITPFLISNAHFIDIIIMKNKIYFVL